jgi:hypothetical protein
MLVSPRLYRQATEAGRTRWTETINLPNIRDLNPYALDPAALQHAQEMLLLHQAGSVKVGEVVR